MVCAFLLLISNYYIAAYVGALLINVFGALTYLIASVHNGIDNRSGTTFGMSIVCAVLYTPCSFVCWYRPLYKAFRWAVSRSWIRVHYVFTVILQWLPLPSERMVYHPVLRS